ncbi:hypothetical protein [Reichenbachiella sp. MALMAid0571]|uniref:hypothetical protein n=1 Tax=Reichenbachiella sp. MALMAid0571 TaxID=3143939 RepID=UPI0032DF9147
MKKIIYILAITLIQVGCVTDPLKEINEGKWNHEKTVLDIGFEFQIGQGDIVVLDDKTGAIELKVAVGLVPDLSKTEMKSLQLPFGAKSSISVGETLDFDNATNSASIMVTSATGQSREYTITMIPFIETLEGSYEIDDLVVYGGTGPEYGGASVIPMMNKSWLWSDSDGPGKELDNSLTFTFEGLTEEGNTFGTVTNDAGDDGKYADFIYTRDPVTDVNNFYRAIPKGESKWLRDYQQGKIIFTFSDGSTHLAELIGAGTEDMGNGKSKTTENQALVFNLSGQDDWNKIYSDYDKFVKRPRRYWIDITKQ